MFLIVYKMNGMYEMRYTVLILLQGTGVVDLLAGPHVEVEDTVLVAPKVWRC